MPNPVKKDALPSLSIHRRALVSQQQTFLFTIALTGFYLLGSISIVLLPLMGQKSHTRVKEEAGTLILL